MCRPGAAHFPKPPDCARTKEEPPPYETPIPKPLRLIRKTRFQNVLWREWHAARHTGYTDQLYTLVSGTHIGWHKAALILKGLLSFYAFLLGTVLLWQWPCPLAYLLPTYGYGMLALVGVTYLLTAAQPWHRWLGVPGTPTRYPWLDKLWVLGYAVGLGVALVQFGSGWWSGYQDFVYGPRAFFGAVAPLWWGYALALPLVLHFLVVMLPGLAHGVVVGYGVLTLCAVVPQYRLAFGFLLLAGLIQPVAWGLMFRWTLPLGRLFFRYAAAFDFSGPVDRRRRIRWWTPRPSAVEVEAALRATGHPGWAAVLDDVQARRAVPGPVDDVLDGLGSPNVWTYFTAQQLLRGNREVELILSDDAGASFACRAGVLYLQWPVGRDAGALLVRLRHAPDRVVIRTGTDEAVMRFAAQVDYSTEEDVRKQVACIVEKSLDEQTLQVLSRIFGSVRHAQVLQA